MPMPLTDAEARSRLAKVQRDIETELGKRAEAESDIADADDALASLRRQERDLLIYLTPERAGVPRVIRK